MKDYILSTETLRQRLILLEYDNLSKKNFKNEIKRIYYEETGTELDVKMEVYFSSDFDDLARKSSSYDGTAIHFYSDNEEVNEMYIISQGTQDSQDVDYILRSLVAGINFDQASDTNNFTKKAKKEFGIKDKKTPVIGLSHSLGHNNNVTAYLAFDTFDEIYSVNGAQANIYNLYQADFEFNRYLKKHYPHIKNNTLSLANISEKDLIYQAKIFYKNKAKNIHQTISLNDPLYAISGQNGFFTLGEVDYINTNPKYPGLRDIIDKIPNSNVADVRNFAIKYTLIKENDGNLDEFIKDVTGFDISILDNPIKTYIFNPSKIDSSLKVMNDKVPDLMERMDLLNENANAIFTEFELAGYISKEQKDEIVKEIGNINKELQLIPGLLEQSVTSRNIHSLFKSSYPSQYVTDLNALLMMDSARKSIKKSLSVLQKDEYKDILNQIVESHSIIEILNANSIEKQRGRYYHNNQLYTTSVYNGSEIKLNISFVMKMYTESKMQIENKKWAIDKLEKIVLKDINDYFNEEQSIARRRIFDIKQNPASYAYMFNHHISYLSGQTNLVRANGVIPNQYDLINGDLESTILKLRKTTKQAEEMLVHFHTSIGKIFKEEQDLSNIFSMDGVLNWLK